MTTDLEAEIRDALQARAAAVTDAVLRPPTQPRATRRRRSAVWAVAAAVAMVAAVAVGVAVWPRGHGGGGTPAAGSAGAPPAGSNWRLVEVDTPATTLARPPADIVVSLRFNADGTLVADDTVNAVSGRYRSTATGFDVSYTGSTSAAYAGHDRIRRVVSDGIGALFTDADGGPVQVESQLRGNRLTLLVSGYTLVFRADPITTGPRRPSASPTTSK